MIQQIEKRRCNGCECCVNVCPVNAIHMSGEDSGFRYPKVDESKCIRCSNCLEKCPALNYPNHVRLSTDHYGYAARYDDTDVRLKSTSGGISYALSEAFITLLGGVVYGVRFTEDYGINFACAGSVDELSMFQGSKYLQCEICDTYKDIRKKLLADVYVLFVGMPCQVVALKTFLGREYSKLYTMDMICFGIPSPFVWYKYLECFHYRDKIQGIEFKNKDNGWKKWQVKIKEDSKEKCFGNNGNLYMNSYLQRYNIRESCFFCKIKGMARCSDFTIGDAWGIAEKNKRLNDDKGLSSIVVHSDKAQQLFEKIIDKLTYKQYNAYELMAGNWATNNCPTPNEHYREFWNDYQKLEIDELFEKYLGRMNLYE